MSQTQDQDNRFNTISAAQSARSVGYNFSPNEMNELFVGLLRSTRVFERGLMMIEDNHFNSARESHYRLLWIVTKRCREEFGIPSRSMLMVELYREIENAPDLIHPDLVVDLLAEDQTGVVWQAFSQVEVSVNHSLGLLQRFLHTRLIANPLKAMLASVPTGEQPAGLDEFLDGIQDQRRRIEGMNTLPLVEAVPALNTVLMPSSEFRPTGISWIDNSLGGMRVGDANGLLGITGGGKSTLGTQISVSCAKVEHTEAEKENRVPGMSILVTYEESAAKAWPRIWSCAMEIDRARLDVMTNPSEELSTRGTMHAYERHLGQEGDGEVMCEQERWEKGRRQLNRTLKILDMSGAHPYESHGNGGLAEIVVAIDSLQQQEQQPVYQVTMDWVGLICTRLMDATGANPDHLRRYISNFGDEARREIAERFSCTAWLIHQIAPQEGMRSPTALLHHTQAQESKAFALPLAVCGCLGIPDKSNGCRRLNWSKVRYKAQEDIQPTTLKINSQFARMDDMSHLYVVDEAGRQFMSRDQANQIHGATPQEPAASSEMSEAERLVQENS